MPMKNVIQVIMCTFFMLPLTGCMTTTKMNQIMSSWEGHHVSDLIASWGPPAQVIDDGKGGKIYCYQYSSAIYMPGTTTTHGNAYTYGNQMTFNASTYTSPGYTIPVNKNRMFWTNENGIIYRWSWKGL
jgi:hypothetical protein